MSSLQQISIWLIAVFVVATVSNIGLALFRGKRAEFGDLLAVWLLWAVFAVAVTGFYLFVS